MNIRKYLENNKIIADGAFGTYFAEKYSTDLMPEAANTLESQKVIDIHREYINSGAVLIRTNTFASNTELLRSGLDEVKRNIRAAVQNAKVAAKDKDVFIAGNIGPIPSNTALKSDEVQNQYYEIAVTFLEQGIEILNFETFSDTDDIVPVIKHIKQDYSPFVLVGFSVNQFGYSSSGRSAKKLIAEAALVEEIDATGLNCGVGPLHIGKIFSKINLNNGKFILANPNAGYPNIIRNRVSFSDNYDYFAEKLSDVLKIGVDIAGGCCGTTPKFIKSLAENADIKQSVKPDSPVENSGNGSAVKNSAFYCNNGILKKKKLIAVELAPPANADDEKLLEAAEALSNSGVDVLTFPDSPSGRTRVDSVLMAQKVKNETGLCVMPHICCRDKNTIAMRSTLLGSHINGINNMLIITGDPIPSMARQTIKSVFNFDSVGLMKIVQEMNTEVFAENPLVFGGAINQGRKHLDFEIKRVRRKMETGASFFLTQPVFCKEEADKIRTIKEETGARILVGIMPLISRKNAVFMKNEIAGVNVPDEVVELYPEQPDREKGEAVGISIAKKVIGYTEDFADGYYFSFPFNRVHLLKKIIGGNL